jgi:hypothetical protein
MRRPRTRWADVVQSDALQMLGIRGWRRRAANRDEWRRLMGEAKAQNGAVALKIDGIFENYIPTNLYSFHTLHINATLKQKKVHLSVARFICTIWLNRP